MEKKKKINWFYPLFAFLLLLNISGIFLLKSEKKSYADLKSRVRVSKVTVPNGLIALSNLEKIENVFIDSEEDILNFIKTIEENKANFSDLSIKFDEGRQLAKSRDNFLVFTLQFTSSYQRGIEFVSRILSGPLLVEIVSLEAAGKEDFISSSAFIVVGKLFLSKNYSQ